MTGRATDKWLEAEARCRREQMAALTWQPIGKAPVSTGPGVLGYSFEAEAFRPRYAYPRQYEDPEMMFQVQVQKANFMRHECLGRLPGLYVEIKGQVESLFGCQVRLSGEDLPTMECLWVLPLEDDLQAIVERGLPPPHAGIMPKVLAFTEYFRQRLPEGFYLTPHGMLSPFATAAAIVGGQLYTELRDRPQLVHQLLGLITEATIACQVELYEICGVDPAAGDHFLGSWLPGPQVGGDDVISISPAMIREFEAPYLRRLARGLGCRLFYHYCPHPQDTRERYTRHPLPAIMEVPEVAGLNSQPLGYWVYLDYYEELRQRGIAIEGHKELPEPHDEADLVRWAEAMCAETYGRSGIHLTLRNIGTPAEMARFKAIWDAL